MKNWLPVLVLLAGLGSSISFAQAAKNHTTIFKSPLDNYIETLRVHTSDAAAIHFAQNCAIHLSEALPRFAFSNDEKGTWHAVKNLPHAYDNIEMDLIGTAEVWKTSKGTVVEEWNAALDVGGFERTLYCFDDAGKLLAIDVSNYQLPTDEGTVWGMHERWVRQKKGTYHATVPFHFVGLNDQNIPVPKLDEDSRKFAADWGKRPPSLKWLRELKLPASLFQ